LTKHVREVSQANGRNRAINILNTKIPTDPYKMAIFPAGIPYSLQKPYEWQHWLYYQSNNNNCRTATHALQYCLWRTK